jgi:SAM-dependent methyltransferase
MTLVDLSEDMLAVSRQLNPECEHLCGDMRTLRLGRVFDAVLVHDAIDYMTTEDHLRAAFETAFAHCRPGGVALFVPDEIAETFEPGSDHGGVGDVRYLEWSWDPDPTDTWTLTESVFLLRSAGTVRSVHETHRHGLFPRAAWLGLLRETGFEASAILERTTEDRAPREMFLGRRLTASA